MSNQLLTEEDVKRRLDIDDFRHIKKQQLIEFVSALPDMDKEVAIKCVEQFPHFKDYSNTIISHFYQLCENAVEKDKNDAVKAYEKILDELSTMLKRPFMRKSERQYIIEKMIEVGQHIEEVEQKKRNFIQRTVESARAIAGIGIVVGGAILGAKIIRKD